MRDEASRRERARPRETDRRKLLLKAAFEEVAERGFSSVTLEAIADRAGVSKGVTLYYFESKEELFRELFQWVIDSLHQRMAEEIARHPDARDQMDGLANVIFASPEKNRAFYAVFVDFTSLAVRNESYRKVNAAFYAGCSQLEQAIVAKGVADGSFPPQDVEKTTVMLRALFDGLMLRWLCEENPSSTFEAYRRQCREQSLRILGLPAPDPSPDQRRSP